MTDNSSENIPPSESSVWRELLGTSLTYGWIDAGGVRTRYLDTGPRDASAVILLHGTQGSLETFCKNIGALSHEHRVIAYDMAGSGFSEKPDRVYDIPFYSRHLGDVMDALGIETASLVGVSLGSLVAARFAADSADRVDQMILIAATGLSWEPATVDRVVSARGAAVDDPTWERVRSIIRNLVFDDSSVMPDIVAVRQRAYRLPDAKTGMVNTLTALQDPARREGNLVTHDEWSGMQMPVLLILAVDTDDWFLKTGRELATILPNATTAEMRNVNHWPHLEDPANFNDLALKFFKTGHIPSGVGAGG